MMKPKCLTVFDCVLFTFQLRHTVTDRRIRRWAWFVQWGYRHTSRIALTLLEFHVVKHLTLRDNFYAVSVRPCDPFRICNLND